MAFLTGQPSREVKSQYGYALARRQTYTRRLVSSVAQAKHIQSQRIY